MKKIFGLFVILLFLSCSYNVRKTNEDLLITIDNGDIEKVKLAFDRRADINTKKRRICFKNSQ